MMKTAASFLLVTLAMVTQTFADSKRTAEYLLSDPCAHQDEEVTLDVAFVKPVHWVSPFQEIAFYHAATLDRSDRKRGGTILVAVPAEDSSKFAKKYGMDFEGKSESDMLKGVFMIAGDGDKTRGRRGIWVIDTTGQLAQLISERKRGLPVEAEMQPMGPGRPGPGR